MLTRDDEVVGSVLFGAAAPFESSFARKFVAVVGAERAGRWMSTVQCNACPIFSFFPARRFFLS